MFLEMPVEVARQRCPVCLLKYGTELWSEVREREICQLHVKTIVKLGVQLAQSVGNS